MKFPARIWFISVGLLALLCTMACTAIAQADEPPPRTVVVLLFDGFAPRLLDGIAAPNLERIRREGAWSHRMVPAFPTVSLINQTTISESTLEIRSTARSSAAC